MFSRPKLRLSPRQVVFLRGDNKDKVDELTVEMLLSTPKLRNSNGWLHDFFSADGIAAGSDIAYVSWAYGSSQVFPAGALALKERLAQ